MTTTHPASPAAVSTVLTRLRALTKARDFEAARDVETSILRTLVTAAAHGEDIREAAQVWRASEGGRWFDPMQTVTVCPALVAASMYGHGGLAAYDPETARAIEDRCLRTLVAAATHGEDIRESAQVWYEAEGDRWYSDQDETRADYIYRSSLEEQEAAERDHEIWSALHLARPVDSTHEEREAAAMGYEGW